MRITFVSLGWEQLGISLLSAIAKRYGHQVNLAFSTALFNDRYNLNIPVISGFFDDTKEIINTIVKQMPDVVAFSPLTCTYRWMLEVAGEVKLIYPDTKIIFGGVHVSAVPENVIVQKQVDYACVGEGDLALPMILKAIEQGANVQIPNTIYKSSDGQVIRGEQNAFIRDLDSLPIFDKPLWEDYIRLGDTYFTMASRGCPYRCTYCFNNYYSKLNGCKPGEYVRHRSVEHMLQELRLAKKRYNPRLIEFEDDVFTINKQWLKEFLYYYKKEIKIPFHCLVHPIFMSDETARWLSEAGCQYVQMGVQSMDEEFRRENIKRFEKNEQIEAAMKVINKYNLEVKVDHMFGLLDEPLGAQQKAKDFYDKYKPYRIQTFWINFFPGTEMTSKALESGYITRDEFNSLNEGFSCNFYRDSSKILDPKKIRVYKACEVYFKLLPVLPTFILKRINLKVFESLPASLCSFISFIADIISGLMKNNPDHIFYIKYYLHHLRCFFLKKLKIPPPPATRPLNSKAYKLDTQFVSFDTEGGNKDVLADNKTNRKIKKEQSEQMFSEKYKQ